MRELHIIAGLISLLAGVLALAVRKGGTLHRQGGLVFVAAMATMTASAFISARWLSFNLVNAAAATLTCYLVVSGWLAIQRRFAVPALATAILLLLALPVPWVTGMLVYWLVKLARQRWRRVVVGAAQAAM